MELSIVMPAYNEAEGIEEFIGEIHEAFQGHSIKFIVVDDKSTDGTISSLERLAKRFPLEIISNDKNLGHGPSTLRALRAGLMSDFPLVLSVDGDGQFRGEDLVRVAIEVAYGDLHVVEGVRTSRKDPLFRKITSLVTRVLVFSRCKTLPGDANTPLRCYQRSSLESLLETIPKYSVIPNLWLSAAARNQKLKIKEISVESLSRRGSDSTGTMWGKGVKFFPTTRFIKFCLTATGEWLLKEK